MFEKIAESSRSRFLMATGPATEVGDTPKVSEGDAPIDGRVSQTKGSGLRVPSYGEVLEDVNRLSHLLGRFLQAADGLVGANAARTLRRTPVRPRSRQSLRPERRDSGANAADRAQGRKLAAERPSSGGAPELVGGGLAEHEWMLAAAGGDLERMAALLDSEPGLLNRKDPVTGLTAAHWLAKRGNDWALLELVRLAGNRGLQLDLNSRAGGGGYTPLHLAAMQGHQTVIKLLVGAYNADVDARDYAGRKAWQYLGSGVPSKLRELVGAREEVPPPGTPAQPKSGARSEEAEVPPKKPQFLGISSVQRFFQPNFWRWMKTHRGVD